MSFSADKAQIHTVIIAADYPFRSKKGKKDHHIASFRHTIKEIFLIVDVV